MSFLNELFSILNKLTPNRKEAYYNELKQLEVDYQKALENREDTKAATIRKKMVELRQKLGLAGEDL